MTNQEAYFGNYSQGMIYKLDGSSFWRADLMLQGKRLPVRFGTETREKLIASLDKADKEHGESLALMKSHRDQFEIRRREGVETMKAQITVGSLLHGSWGYEQTQCELFQVVAVKGSMVEIRRVSTREETEKSGMAAAVYPIKDSFMGEVLRLKISSRGVRYKKLCTLTPAKWDRSFYRSWYG